MRALGPLVAALIAVALVISGALFTVDQRQNAMVFQLGEVKEVITKPGLQLQVADDPERALFRHAHPVLRRRRAAALHHLREEAGAGRLLRQVAHRRRARSSMSACRATSFAPRRACVRPFRTCCRPSSAGARCMTWSPARATRSWTRCAQRPTRTCGRIGVADRRRAPEARRLAAGGQRIGLRTHAGRAQAHRQRAALRGRGGSRAHSCRCRPAARGDSGERLSRRAARQGRGRREGRGDLRARRSPRMPSSTGSTAAWRPIATPFGATRT